MAPEGRPRTDPQKDPRRTPRMPPQDGPPKGGGGSSDVLAHHERLGRHRVQRLARGLRRAVALFGTGGRA
eukprot:805523-Prymnesium_polylepis.1